MSAESHIDAFLDLFGKFEKEITRRGVSGVIPERRDRIALFGIYMVTRRDE